MCSKNFIIHEKAQYAVQKCSCGVIQLVVGAATIRMTPEAFASFLEMGNEKLKEMKIQPGKAVVNRKKKQKTNIKVKDEDILLKPAKLLAFPRFQ